MRSEKGMTLIEMLGAIAIFMIASVIISKVLSNIILQNNIIVDQNYLSREANLVFSQIEKEFKEHNEIEIQLSSQKQLYIRASGDDWTPLHNNLVIVQEFIVNGTPLDFSTNEVYTLQPLNQIYSLGMTLAAHDDPNQLFTLNTTLKHYSVE